MGCDGGTIPTRDEQVRLKKKPEQKDKNAERAYRWKHCAISQELLVKPIVACELGRLYNKETILEFLLDKSKFEDIAAMFDHIKGLKDVKQLNLSENPEKAPRGPLKEGDGGYHDYSRADYICPVVGLEMTGKYRFCFIWTCGCVVSERAVKEVKSDTCHKCGKDYRDEDVVTLNPPEEEVAGLRARMEDRRAAAKAAKKAKKASKHKLADTDDTVFKKPCLAGGPPPDTKTADKKTGKPGKLITSTKSTIKEKLPLKKGTIQEDKSASQAYKQLFTTHESEKLQQKPHEGWITFNPQYF